MPARRRGHTPRDEAGPVDRTPETVLVGRGWVGGRLQPVEVGLTGEGRILKVGRNVPGGRRWDLGDQVILPAATDLHVHFREPGGPHSAEDLRSGTEAAALGGVATVGDMPNTTPPLTSIERIREKAERARGRLAIDVLLFAALESGAPVARLAQAAGAFKVYLSPTTGIDTPVDMDDVGRLLTEVAASGLSVTAHAEAPRAFGPTSAGMSAVEWDSHRPPESEHRAIEALLTPEAGARLNVAHVTTVASADRIRSAGQFFEVTPHHLLLSERPTSDARFKVNPPLRSERDRAALWDSFQRGRVPALASDHAPHPIDEKAKPFAEAPSGVPGVETMVPLLLEKVRAGDLSLEVLLRAASDRPARWLGLPQGRLAAGHLANLIVVDFRSRSTIRAEKLRTRCGWTPFEGWPAVFPTMHLREGERIVDDGQFVGRHDGRIVRPEYARS